jgi:PAS domain S-box-containing protein
MHYEEGLGEDLERLKTESERLRQEVDACRRTEQQRRDEQRRIALLDQELTAATSNASLEGLLQAFAEALVRHLGVSFARIWILRGDVLELCASAGMYTHRDGGHARIPVGLFKIGRIAQQRRPHLTNQVIGDPDVHDQDWARREGMVAFAGYPLVFDQRLVGVIGMFSRQALPDSTFEALTAVSYRLSLAIARLEAEQALLRSERHFRALIEHSADAIALVDATGTVLYASPSTGAVLGFEPEELVGRNALTLIHPDDVPRARERLEALLAAPQHSVTSELRARRKNDDTIWVESTATNLLDDDSVGAIVSNFRDITRRKAAEQRLRSQAGLLDLPRDAIIAMRPDGTIEFWNRGAEAMYGWSREEALGRLSHDLLQAEFPVPRSELEQALLTDGHWQGELQHRTRSGERITVASRWALNTAEDGRPVGFLEINTDITEQKEIEENLRHTQRLESLGVLAGGIAHDFNNLLTGIMGHASLALEMLPADNPARESIALLTKASQRAADLTRQLLAYAGKGQFIIRPLDLSALVREIAGLIRASVPDNVELRLSLAPELPLIEADTGQLQQVVMNLIVNAAEAIEPGKDGVVTVTTGCHELDQESLRSALAEVPLEPGPYVFLEVRDNGQGMDEETLRKIFDPFFTTKFLGRGLGLAAVAGIVRVHKAALKVESAPGQGTTFQVLVPAQRGSTAENRCQPARTEERQAEGTVLVVDDEQVVRDVANAALARRGYRVLTAENGRAALEIFRQQPQQISLVVLDLTMPVMSGQETLRALRAIRPDLPVILSSGYNQIEAIRHFTGSALAGFIQKPYTAAQLAEKVAEVLRSG